MCHYKAFTDSYANFVKHAFTGNLICSSQASGCHTSYALNEENHKELKLRSV